LNFGDIYNQIALSCAISVFALNEMTKQSSIKVFKFNTSSGCACHLFYKKGNLLQSAQLKAI
jgi:hypothetical protein